MRRKAFTFWQTAGLLAFMFVAAAILFPVFGTRKQKPSHQGCRTNLKLLGLGILQYSQDYDERYPLISSNMGGWADNVLPYMKSRHYFHCPLVEGDNMAPTTDYFYNARLAGLSASQMTDATFSRTILGGDGLPASPTNTTLKALPKSWRTTPDSPATRHLGMANYMFVDGHVKAYNASRIDDGPRLKADGTPSFAVR